MTLADATIYCGIAYYGSNCNVDALLRTARICLRRMGPVRGKTFGLLLKHENPGAMLHEALCTLESMTPPPLETVEPK